MSLKFYSENERILIYLPKEVYRDLNKLIENKKPKKTRTAFVRDLILKEMQKEKKKKTNVMDS